MRQKPIEIGKGANSVFIGFTCPIRSGSRGARVEVEAIVFSILGSRIFGKLKVALEEIVITTP